MAKTAATTKKSSVRKPVSKAAKPAAKSVKSAQAKTVRLVEQTVPVNTKPVSFAARFNRDLTPQALVTEIFGTFILVSVALTATAVLAPLYIGLTMIVLAIIIGGISGAHVNPAVTFGLWTARKFPGFAVVFYWLAQILGGIAAVVAIGALNGKGVTVNFSNFLQFNWGVFAIEVIGTAIFLFGVVAANSRVGLPLLGRAMGVGLSLFAALTVAAGLYTSLGASVDRSSITSIDNVPRVLRLDSAALNPIVAFGATEKTNAQLQGSAETAATPSASRLTLGETIVGTLLGAAIGANLYRIIGRRDTV